MRLKGVEISLQYQQRRTSRKSEDPCCQSEILSTCTLIISVSCKRSSFIAILIASLPFFLAPEIPRLFKTRQTRPLDYLCLVVAPALAQGLCAGASPIFPPPPPPTNVSCPNQPSIGFRLLPFCLILAIIALAPWVGGPPSHHLGVFCLLKTHSSRPKPNTTFCLTSFSSDLYSINTFHWALAHRLSSIHLALQLDLFPLTALVFTGLLVLTFSLDWHSQFLLPQIPNLVGCSQLRKVLEVSPSSLGYSHLFGIISLSTGALGLVGELQLLAG